MVKAWLRHARLGLKMVIALTFLLAVQVESLSVVFLKVLGITKVILISGKKSIHQY
jgi:hypothetical protein